MVQIVAGNDQGFSFDHVFGEETMQEQIYDQCVVDLIDAAFEGFNATILAYGQTVRLYIHSHILLYPKYHAIILPSCG
jgi:hypothetical protein